MRFDKCEGESMSEQGNLTRRRFIGVAGAAAASVLAPGLAGCGGGDSGGSSTPSGSGGGGGKVTLTWWDYFNEANEKAVNERIAAYQKVKPNVTIKRTGQPFADLKQKLLQGATAGELPDIVVIDNPDHSSFAALGVLADITEQVKEWGQGGEYFEGRGSRRSTRARTTACRTTRTASRCGRTARCSSGPASRSRPTGTSCARPSSRSPPARRAGSR
jgi:hypothetical protein